MNLTNRPSKLPIEPEAPLQNNPKGFVQSAPQGLNQINVTEHNTAIGLGGSIPIRQSFNLRPSALVLGFCFNLGLVLPSLISVAPGKVKALLLTLIIAAAGIGACAAMASDIRIKAAIIAGLVLLTLGFSLVMFLPLL
jgi:hypothetical protein